MKRNRIRNFTRNWTAAAVALMLAVMCAGSAAAFPTKGIDNESASLTLTVTANNLSDGKAISGLELTVYKAADMDVESNGHVTFVLTPEFEEYNEDGPKKIDGGLDPNDFNSSSWADTADNLEEHVLSDAAKGKKFQSTPLVTGTDGKVTFTGLEQGLYLMLGVYKGTEYQSVEVTPAFLTLPQWSEDTGDWLSDAQSKVKPAVTPKPPVPPETPETPKKTSITVQKIWANDDTAKSSRPASVNVELLDADGKTVGNPVALSASNGWKYTWTGLDEGKWSVKESVVPTDYAVSYEETTTAEGKTITVKNTKGGGGVLGESREKTTPKETEKKKKKNVKGTSREGDTASEQGSTRLPQTGQLWWPVWLLSGLAAVLVIIGLILRMSGKKDLKD